MICLDPIFFNFNIFLLFCIDDISEQSHHLRISKFSDICNRGFFGFSSHYIFFCLALQSTSNHTPNQYKYDPSIFTAWSHTFCDRPPKVLKQMFLPHWLLRSTAQKFCRTTLYKQQWPRCQQSKHFFHWGRWMVHKLVLNHFFSSWPWTHFDTNYDDPVLKFGFIERSWKKKCWLDDACQHVCGQNQGRKKGW